MRVRIIQPRLIVAAALLTSTLAAACQAPAPPAATGATAKPAATVAPRTDRLVMSITAPSPEGNSVRDLTPTIMWQVRPMYEYLIGIDPATGKLVPQLATEWTLEPNGMSYRFKLRRGVQFHDNFGEFTAKDVVFTWQNVTSPEAQYSDSAVYRAMITNIDVVNDYEVVFHLGQNAPFFLYWVSQGQSGFEIRSKASWDANGNPTMQGKPMAGTGPYQFKERQAGQFIRYERVPFQHWRVQPEFKEFEFRFQAEPSTRLAALLKGEAHVAGLPQDLLAQAQQQNMKVVQGAALGPRIFLNLACCFVQDVQKLEGWVYPDSPLMDVRVRKALQKAIDLDQLNRAFFSGKGKPMAQTHMHANSPGWNPAWEQEFKEEYGYDPAAARQLLTEAGYGPSKPLRTNLYVINLPQFPGSADVVEAIAGFWRAVGVEPQLVQMDQAQITARSRQIGFSNDIFVSGTSSVEFIGTSAYWTSVEPRGNGYEDPTLDSLFLKLRSEMDETRRNALWTELGNHAFKMHPSINLFWVPAEVAINPAYVGEYTFPGNITGTWTHMEYIKAAK